MRGSIVVPPSAVRHCGSFATALEPASLVDAFMQHPPAGFSPAWFTSGQYHLPSFRCNYDLRLTLEDDSALTRTLRRSPVVGCFSRLPSLFLGTTVSEYAPLPSTEDFERMLWSLCRTANGAQLLIIKDLPWRSPLIPQHANRQSELLIERASANKYLILHGQALAYVPMDFASLDEYLARMSSRRRKEFRRKLKSRCEMTLEELETGSVELRDPNLIAELYQLYLNVYRQSKYHFDRLSLPFFAQVLGRKDSGGIVFLYREGRRIVGFNLCYVHNRMLVDKYVGFRYPDAPRLNLYFVSWFSNLEFALRRNLTHYVAGWTDPEVKRALGASFTFTRHAVLIVNPALRAMLTPWRRLFEPDAAFEGTSV